MMRRVLVMLAMLLALGAASAHAAAPPLVQINDLVEQAARFDGTVVTVEGEVIGDVMIRGTGGWINVTDGTNDIGIWAPAEALRRIRYVGRYHQRGDTVRVVGEFRRADPEHGGDLALRAAELVVVSPGGPVAHPIKPHRFLLAAFSMALAGALAYWRWRAA